VDQDDALELLGLPVDADLPTIKRRFRALAHDLHPDRGGDAAHFARINDAYRQLASEERPSPTVAKGPTVAQGRPSRTSPATSGMSGAADPRGGPRVREEDVVVVDRATLAAMREGRPTRMTQLLLAGLIATILAPADPSSDEGREPAPTGTDDAPRSPMLLGLLLVSRAPASRLNRIAHVLSEDATSTLSIVPVAGGRALDIGLRARSRAARRRLARTGQGASTLPAEWRRQRSDATTSVTTTHTVAGTPRERALDAALHISTLLLALDWPLEQWSLDGERSVSPPRNGRPTTA
jgi:hypothetical protein